LFAYRRTSLLPAGPPVFPYSSRRLLCGVSKSISCGFYCTPFLSSLTHILFFHCMYSYSSSVSPTCRILSSSVRISNILPLTIIKSMVSVPTQSVQHAHTLANGIILIQTQFFLYVTHSDLTLNTSITVPPTYYYTRLFFIHNFQILHYDFLYPNIQ
jgi:hypothetical protein